MVYCGQMVEGEMFPSSQYKRLIISKNRRLVKGGAAVFCPFLEKIPPPSVREVGGLLHRLLALSFRASDRCHWRGNPQSFSCKFAEKRKNCAIWEQIATPVCGLARNDRLFRQPNDFSIVFSSCVLLCFHFTENQETTPMCRFWSIAKHRLRT